MIWKSRDTDVDRKKVSNVYIMKMLCPQETSAITKTTEKHKNPKSPGRYEKQVDEQTFTAGYRC